MVEEVEIMEASLKLINMHLTMTLSHTELNAPHSNLVENRVSTNKI